MRISHGNCFIEYLDEFLKETQKESPKFFLSGSIIKGIPGVYPEDNFDGNPKKSLEASLEKLLVEILEHGGNAREIDGKITG